MTKDTENHHRASTHSVKGHLKILGIAAAIGLSVYAVIQLLWFITLYFQEKV